MADSNITKRALAAALKDLMAESSFDKINVGQICQLCQMNRKSFYYHFRDKYDLLNWIFDTEFITLAAKLEGGGGWQLLEEASRYMYRERSFYIKALSTSGPNSFPEHLVDFSIPLLQSKLRPHLGEGAEDPFVLRLYAQGLLSALEGWLTARSPMSPEDFVAKLRLALPFLPGDADQI